MATVVSRAPMAKAGDNAPTPKRWLPWLRRGGVAVVLIALGTAVVAKLGDPQVLPITKVRVEGAFAHVDEQRLRAVISATVKGNFLNANVDQVRRAVQAMPWVQGASVDRIWPATLRVVVVEHLPMARWRGAGEGLVNQFGEVFSAEAAGYEELPVFHGRDGSAAAVSAAYREMTAALAPLGLGIAKVTLNARRAWRVTLANGIEVLLGRDGRMLRLQRFVRAYPDALAHVAEDIAQVDLRYTNGFAVRWKSDARTDAKKVLMTKMVA